MRDSKLSRRDMLRASTVLAAGAVFAEPLVAAAPEPTPLSPALIQAARKEGTLAFYTGMDIPVAEGLSKAFEAKYPGIKVRVKRSGAERVFQRIGKEEEEVVYAGEGTPLIIAPSAVFKTAPSPNAARLFQSFLFSIEAQQGLVDAAGMCSFHRLVKEKAGRRPLSTIKLIKSDSEAMEAQREDIKARYRSIFGA
jgi:hypothetical protein